MKIESGKRLAAFFFATAAALLVVSMVFVYRMGLIAVQGERTMIAERLLLQHLEEFLSTLKDAETGARGYLLTGEEPYLEPYTQALATVHRELDYLRQGVATGDLDSNHVAAVMTLSGEKLAELNEAVRLRRNQDVAAATGLVRTGRDRELMDQIRGRIGQLQMEEQGEFDGASRRADSAIMVRTTTFVGICLLNLTFLAWAFHQISRNRKELERLVQERTARLREMVDELQHVSYAITHDMRAPLRTMSAFASLLQEHISQYGSAEDMDYSQRILTATERLDKMIQDALHYTKSVLQDMPLEPVDLSKLVRGLIETYPNLQPDKADIHIEGDLPVVRGNQALLTQCFSNLLDNAVKFVAPGTRPKVTVRGDTNSDRATVSVEDNGIGIPPHAQPRLFKMFERLTNEYEGGGIGLAIVRKVVERMGGKVGAESRPGSGSRFWIEFPLAKGT